MWAMKQDDSEHPAEMAWRGIALCREDDWQEGLYWLSLATESEAKTAELPGLLFSYLGYGLARYKNQPKEGLKLCRLGVEVELHQAESYYLLAQSHLFLGDRRSAVPVIEQGLQVDTGHEGLNQLKLLLGQRRRPVFPSLSRRHVLNRWLGKIRHRALEWWGRSNRQTR